MKVKMVMNAEHITREDLRTFIQAIREWELRSPKSNIIGILLDTDPQMGSVEVKDIFEGIFPNYKNLVEIPLSPEEVPGTGMPILRLGTRGLKINGELVGACAELTLSIGEATDEQIKQLQEATIIELVKIGQG